MCSHFHLSKMCGHFPVRRAGILLVLVNLLTLGAFEYLKQVATLICHALHISDQDFSRHLRAENSFSRSSLRGSRVVAAPPAIS